jgi:hypothetical protein
MNWARENSLSAPPVGTVAQLIFALGGQRATSSLSLSQSVILEAFSPFTF